MKDGQLAIIRLADDPKDVRLAQYHGSKYGEGGYWLFFGAEEFLLDNEAEAVQLLGLVPRE